MFADKMKQLRKRVPRQLSKLAHFARYHDLYTAMPSRPTFNEDGMATIHDASFTADPRFVRAYKAGLSTGSWDSYGNLRWRAYICCWAAEKGSHLEGDFVDCGVFKGGLARTVMEYVDFDRLDKTYWLLDTYEGLVDRLISPAERARGLGPGGYEPSYDRVVKNFSGKRAEIIKGPVPDTLPQVKAERVAYLSIDMNTAAPEIAAAEFFWDKLSSGACIVLDDYGWRLSPDQKPAFDAFARARGVQVLSLPTGQGLIVKP
jgi:O-methyltransferase